VLLGCKVLGLFTVPENPVVGLVKGVPDVPVDGCLNWLVVGARLVPCVDGLVARGVAVEGPLEPGFMKVLEPIVFCSLSLLFVV